MGEGRGARKGGAPDWHFADEESVQSEHTKTSPPPAAANRNTFIVRAIVMLILLISAMYLFNIKETNYLSKTHKPSTWFDVKPHWQTTEELKLRMQPRKPVSHPNPPAETVGYDDDWMANVDAEEWLERMDLAGQEEVLEAHAGGTYDAFEYDDIFGDLDNKQSK